MPPTVVGIDLGTTFSLAAYMDKGKPVVVRDDERRRPGAERRQLPRRRQRPRRQRRPRSAASATPTTPSTASSGSWAARSPTCRRNCRSSRTRSSSARSSAGRKVLHVKIAGHEHTPEELSALILQEVRRRAGNPTKAVITVPAYFDDAPAAGHARRRPHRRPGRAAHRQRADRRRPGLRPRPAAHRHRRRLRPRRRHLRLLDPVHQRRRLQGAQHQRRHLPRRRRLRPRPHGRGGRARWASTWRTRDPELLQHLRDQGERVKIALSSAESAEFVVDLPERRLSYRRTFTRAELEGAAAAVHRPHAWTTAARPCATRS